MNYLIIINDGPYGTEKPYNALRLAMSLQKNHNAKINIALLGDGVINAFSGQDTPEGYYNIERMLKAVLAKKGKVILCTTCMNARGMKAEFLLRGAEKSSLDEIARLTEEADKVLVF